MGFKVVVTSKSPKIRTTGLGFILRLFREPGTHLHLLGAGTPGDGQGSVSRLSVNQSSAHCLGSGERGVSCICEVLSRRSCDLCPHWGIDFKGSLGEKKVVAFRKRL